MPASAHSFAWLGPIATSIAQRGAFTFHELNALIESAMPVSSRCGSRLTSSKQIRGGSSIAHVITLSSAA